MPNCSIPDFYCTYLEAMRTIAPYGTRKVPSKCGGGPFNEQRWVWSGVSARTRRVRFAGAGEVLPRIAERKPECGERPPWPVGPSQTVRRTGRCRGRSPSCYRRHQHRHRRRRRLHPLRPCTASRRPHAPTDLGNPGCTVKQRPRRADYPVYRANFPARRCNHPISCKGIL